MDTAAMIGRLLVSLAAVLGVMWVIARRARKGMKGKGDRVVEIIDRASLGRSSSVAVVRVNDRAFVLGVADQQVSLLGETDLAESLAAKGETPSARKRTSHRAPAAPARKAVPSERLQVPATRVPAAAPAPAEPVAARTTGPLAGSALSPQTWRQTVESLRDLTSR
ncbi:FliO/MopB family protein [Jatrophihabitans fulvus]